MAERKSIDYSRMSDYTDRINEEREEYLGRLAAYDATRSPRPDLSPSDAPQRGYSQGRKAGMHPEHLGDFRRFGLRDGKLYVPKFEIFTTTSNDVASRYSLLDVKIKDGGDDLLHVMYSDPNLGRPSLPVADFKVAGKKEYFIYLCVKGYNESEAQFNANAFNRHGQPWYIATDSYLHIVDTDADQPEDQSGVIGQDPVLKYTKVGKLNIETELTETYIDQQVYLTYDAPPLIPSGTQLLYWKPSFNLNADTVNVGKGLNLIPTQPASGKEQPEIMWKREFYTEGDALSMAKNTTTYYFVKLLAPQWSSYVVADDITHRPGGPGYPEAAEGSISQFFLRTTLANNTTAATAMQYDVIAQTSANQPSDTDTAKHQFLGSVTRNVGGDITTWEWRLNHAFYWHGPSLAVGSYGSTAATDEAYTAPAQ